MLGQKTSTMKQKNTRQRILDATQRLIEKDGAIRLTTKEIAREAKCAEGTLFKYFARKEDLCVAVVLENSPKFKETIAARQPGKKSVAKNLEEIALAAIRFSEKLIPLGATLLADANLLAQHRKKIDEQRGGPVEVFRLIAAYVEGEQQIGRIGRHVRPLSVAGLLFGPCFYRAFIRQAMGRPLFSTSDKEFVDGLVATLVRGLSPANDKDAG
jgi:AcrR family transcriptional regulator